MDGLRFDELARTWATASRRRLLRAALGATAGLFVRGHGAAAACNQPGQRCGAGAPCCAGAVCKLTGGSVGTCRACPAGTATRAGQRCGPNKPCCGNLVCKPGSNGIRTCRTCPTNTSPCGGQCVNTHSDEANCGACGVVCSGTTACCVKSRCAAPCGDACCANCFGQPDETGQIADYFCCPPELLCLSPKGRQFDRCCYKDEECRANGTCCRTCANTDPANPDPKFAGCCRSYEFCDAGTCRELGTARGYRSRR